MSVDLGHLDLTEAARLVRERHVSPIEITEACLARIVRLEPDLNAFITICGEVALQAAGRARETIIQGGERGLLSSMPVALKDLFHMAGALTTAGSKVLANNVSVEDAEAVRRLRSAGAVFLGKLNLHEFAYGATGVNPHYGVVHNPWDIDRIAGGSSSGSAAAVAAGECLASLGTDTGGSVRIPAALCGIVGLKPTYGRISRRGVIPLSWSLDHVGTLTRTVRDAALLLEAVAGEDPGDPSSAPQPIAQYSRRLGERQDLKGLRIGKPREHFFDHIDAGVLRAVIRAIEKLEELGAEVREVSLPHIGEAPAAVGAIQAPEALAYHHRWLNERPEDYGEDVRGRLESGAAYLALHYVQAQRLREMLIREWREQVFDRVGVLVAPTTPIVATPIGESGLAVTMELIRLTNPFNLAGVPAISIPCGFSEAGLPIGLQLAAPWFQEAELLRVAHVYEQATEWRKRQIPILSL